MDELVIFIYGLVLGMILALLFLIFFPLNDLKLNELNDLKLLGNAICSEKSNGKMIFNKIENSENLTILCKPKPTEIPYDGIKIKIER